MLLQQEQPTINLSLPSSWQSCTTPQLEAIATCMLNEERRAILSRCPNNNETVKVEVLLSLGNLSILSDEATPVVPIEDQYIVVKHLERKTTFLRTPIYSEPFVLYIWQIHHWLKHELTWLDKPAQVMQFPYPTLYRRLRKFQGPSVLMQNFSWAQYRIAGEWLQFYFDSQKHLYDLSLKGDASPLDIQKAHKQLDSAKAGYLATIFTKKVLHIDEDTRRLSRSHIYLSNQSTDNAKYFRNFPEYKFRTILFWWSGMMQYYKRLYPKCFSEDSKDSKSKSRSRHKPAPNPLESYTRLIATIEKYINTKEEDINRKSFTVILQHLDDMIREHEEYERLKSQ